VGKDKTIIQNAIEIKTSISACGVQRTTPESGMDSKSPMTGIIFIIDYQSITICLRFTTTKVEGCHLVRWQSDPV
jgi:hypothetical protein